VSHCTGTPISFLRLERHHLGELEGVDRDEIERHLVECEACAACSRAIVSDARSLPPLARRGRVLTFRRAGAVMSALALAAGLFLLLGRPDPRPLADEGARTKGDGVGFTLVRDDDERLEGGGTYRDGDRFKALVTCTPGSNAAWDLVVYERGEASFPLKSQRSIPCGNEVPLPGAFRLTGVDPMVVCVVWSEHGPVDRSALRQRAPDELDHAVCATLAPAPAP
jgi:hypothetical protein